MEQERREIIINRVRKIVALAEGSSFKDEALTAMALCQRILLENGLTVAEVGAFSEAEERSLVVAEPDHDGAPKVRLERPGALAVGPGGQLYIADVERNQILELAAGDSFKVVAGTGKAGFSGDGGLAVAARPKAPGGMAVGADGTLYVADSGNMRVRAISPRGIISTIAGNGTFGWAGMGTPARAAGLGWPAALTFGPHGDLYIAAEGVSEVLRLGSQGLLVRVAGKRRHPGGIYGIGHPATQASADGPTGIAFDRAGNLFIAGFDTKTLLMVTPGGRMVPPMGVDGFYPRGDGGLATALIEVRPGGRIQVLAKS